MEERPTLVGVSSSGERIVPRHHFEVPGEDRLDVGRLLETGPEDDVEAGLVEHLLHHGDRLLIVGHRGGLQRHRDVRDALVLLVGIEQRLRLVEVEVIAGVLQVAELPLEVDAVGLRGAGRTELDERVAANINMIDSSSAKFTISN